MRFRFSLSPYLEQIDGGAGGGTPPPASSPAAPASTPASAGPAQSPGTSAAPGGSSAEAARRGYTYDEDRSKWIPPYRLEEATSRAEQRAQQAEAQRGETERKLRIAMGVEEGPDPRTAQIKDAMMKLFPKLALLENGEFEQAIQGASHAEEAHWTRHASTMVESAVSSFAKALGHADAKAMGPAANSRMAWELNRFINEDTSGQRDARYNRSDPSLITELISELTGIYVEPVRRTVASAGASAVERSRRLPSSGPSGGIPPTPAPDKPKGAALHEAARQDFMARMTAGQ